MERKVKIKIEVELTSEDQDKLERIVSELISKSSTLIRKEVTKKSESLWENGRKVSFKQNCNVEWK